MSDVLLRRAAIKDVRGIHKLLMGGAGDGLLLPRPLGELYKHIREFCVLENGDDGSVMGCCALSIVWEDIAEIRSLVVHESLRGKKLGQKLVETCLSEAVALGLPQVFTLTYQTEFFAKLGFRIVEKDTLPNKVWADCIHCPKFPDCDEIAMLLDL